MSDNRYSFGENLADDGPVFDAGERRRLRPLTRIIVIAALCLVGAAFAGLVWFAYKEGVRSGDEEAAPVLRADTTPVKRKPAEAGGMEIPHQDKLVFDRIAPAQSQQPVERLLPPPEAPVARPAPVPSTNAASDGRTDAAGTMRIPASDAVTERAETPASPPQTASAPKVSQNPPALPAKPVDDASRPTSLAPPPAPPVVERKPTEPTDAELSEIAPAAGPATQQAAVPAATPESPPTAAPVGPIWRVQLASLTSEARARAEWQRIQKANRDLLGDLALNIEQASLSKGTFYRIQAGPLADRSAARTLCSQLKTRKQDCLVVAP